MTLNRSTATRCAALVIAGAALAFSAGAQTPAPTRLVNTGAPSLTPVVDSASAARQRQTLAGGAKEVLIHRETYAYPGTGRRDPFLSLMNTEELRPLIGDLKLVGIALDPTGRNSVAVLRDVTTKEQYRVKVGQSIGRMRVAAIHQKSVVFGIEEFGYSRQESLAISDSTKVRVQ